MKIKTTELSAALSAMSKITSGKMTLPILSCVKLEVEGDTLILSVSNLDEYQIERVACEGAAKFKTICVNFNQLKYSMWEGEETTFEIVGEFLSVTPCGAKLGILEAEEFPKLPDTSKMEAIGVGCQDLADSIMAVQWASADRAEGRYSLESAHVVGAAKKLYAEATNGRLLCWVEKALIASDFEILIHNDFCLDFCNALARPGATFSRNVNQLCVKHDAGEYFCKIPEAKYPATEQIKPKEMKKIGEFKLAELKMIVGTGIHLSNGRFYLSAKFDFKNDGLRVSFNDSKHSAQMDNKLPGQFKSATTTLDMRYAMSSIDAMLAVGETKATVWMIDELSPIKFTAGDMSVIVMPMRMN